MAQSAASMTQRWDNVAETQPEVDELLTVRQVAKRLKVDDTTVRRWIKDGAIQAITLPHKGKRLAYRIKQSVLDSLLLHNNVQT